MKDEITNPMFKYAKKYDTDNKASVLVKDGKGGTHAIRLSLLSHADDQFVAFDSGADGCLEVYPISSVVRIHLGPESN